MRRAGLGILAVSVMLGCAVPAGATVREQLDELLGQVKGKRIGMITNPAGCDEKGRPDADYILSAPGTTVTAFFSPEHGLRGVMQAGRGDKDYVDPATSIPVYAVYGARKAPTDEQLKNVDVLVYDLQDVGARFYTFMWTMTYCMEAAAKNGKPFYVIDRPNPISGTMVEGAPNLKDFGLIGRLGAGAAFGVATRHGMTVGELATMWNSEWMTPKADLRVVKVRNWNRGQWWDETGRKFMAPSPNMRSLNAAALYPGTCIFEGSNLSEGRGTSFPFEMMGAPFVDGAKYAEALMDLKQPGVRFEAVEFTPVSSKHKNVKCGGVRAIVTDRDNFLPVRNGLNMLQTAYKLYPNDTRLTSTSARLMGIPDLQTRLTTETVAKLESEWQPRLKKFKAVRAKYLLYPEGKTEKRAMDRLTLPPRPAGAMMGTQFKDVITSLPRDEREDRIYEEIVRGNIPDFLRKLKPVTTSTVIGGRKHTVEFFVTPDYMAIGSDKDYFRIPMTPILAQQVADLTRCALPTRKMVDAIYTAATCKLAPSPIPPGPQMITVPVFWHHEELVRAQRTAITTQPLGALVAGDKKDVVVSPKLATFTNFARVAIYGWHRLNGVRIQPLYFGHEATYADYSHGTRLVNRRMRLDGKEVLVNEVLLDPTLAPVLSDEETTYCAAAPPRYKVPTTGDDGTSVSVTKR
ncbi:MAG: DUF1343 domain-containing protein [Candidatus Sumerlaeaceae bacterium]|nr:DUF1343 domain-containing protein [Candidatus Sumerlaeaceae bacterium]